MGVSENKVHPMYGHFNRKYDDKPSKLGLQNFQTNPSETMVNLPPIFQPRTSLHIRDQRGVLR